jgi:hypothetical protein
MSRAATIALAFLLALAGAFVHAPRETTAPGAGEACASAPCCGGECQCGDDCACMVDEAPDAPRDDAPALPERSRGERALAAAAPAAGCAPVTLSNPVDLGAFTRADSTPAAPPSCRLRLAIESRWTT